jgi:hypothetical protein
MGVPVRFALSVPLTPEGDPPTEFRIFQAGWNETAHGPVLFDDEAAQAVLSAHAQRGDQVDVMIDLEHDSVDASARTRRDDAADARGWCRLELRDGELWAVGATWTPDGAARLRDRRQRYISPIVICDSETHRAQSIFNLGLVANPATYDAQALVASRRLTLSRGAKMDPEMVKKALEALKAGDAEAALSILTDLIASAAGGESAEGGDTADSGDEATAAAADTPSEADDDEAKEESAALAKALSQSLGVDASAAAIVGEVKRLRNEVRALSLAREAEEQSQRVELVGELVKLGAELPATAWADPDGRKPASWLATMPIDTLRQRVEAFRARPRPAEPKPPKRDALDATALSDADRIRAEGIEDKAARARFIALRLSRQGGMA